MWLLFIQFHRSFPGPPEIGEDNVRLLAKRLIVVLCMRSDFILSRYLEPDGLCNYLRFHYDVCKVGQARVTGGNNTNALTGTARDGSQPSLQQIMSAVGNVVFKNGIRTTEFFKDHDKLNSGVITENQVCVI